MDSCIELAINTAFFPPSLFNKNQWKYLENLRIEGFTHNSIAEVKLDTLNLKKLHLRNTSFDVVKIIDYKGIESLVVMNMTIKDKVEMDQFIDLLQPTLKKLILIDLKFADEFIWEAEQMLFKVMTVKKIQQLLPSLKCLVVVSCSISLLTKILPPVFKQLNYCWNDDLKTRIPCTVSPNLTHLFIKNEEWLLYYMFTVKNEYQIVAVKFSLLFRITKQMFSKFVNWLKFNKALKIIFITFTNIKFLTVLTEPAISKRKVLSISLYMGFIGCKTVEGSNYEWKNCLRVLLDNLKKHCNRWMLKLVDWHVDEEMLRWLRSICNNCQLTQYETREYNNKFIITYIYEPTFNAQEIPKGDLQGWSRDEMWNVYS